MMDFDDAFGWAIGFMVGAALLVGGAVGALVVWVTK